MAFPWMLAANGLVGLGQSLFAGKSRGDQNAQARKQNRLNFQAANDAWNYTNDMGIRKQEYTQEGIEIARRNQDKNIEFQQLRADSERDYGMQVRGFKHHQLLEQQWQQRAQAIEQLGFNEQAYDYAIEAQDNYKFEQGLNFELAKIGVGIKGRRGTETYQMKGNELASQQRSTRATNSFSMQRSQIESLKGMGKAKAKGQSGRSAGKNVQASIAEYGMQQAEIAEKTMQSNVQYALTNQQNLKDLSNLVEDLLVQKQEIKFGEESFARQDKMARRNLKLQLEQANADAFNQVMLDPVLGPELPEVPNFADYAAEFQDAREWTPPPRPIKGVAPQQQGNFFSDFLNSSGGQAAIGMGIGKVAGMFVDKPPGLGGNLDFGYGGEFNQNNFNTDFGMNYGIN